MFFLGHHQECIPHEYHTIGGIARFAESPLSPPSEIEAGTDTDRLGLCLRVQSVTLLTTSTNPGMQIIRPRRVSDQITPRGRTLCVWPWRRHVPVPAHDEHGNTSPIMKEGHKYGLRAITKARWDTLNEEYLVYKQSLIDEVARAETEMHYFSTTSAANPPLALTPTPTSIPKRRRKPRPSRPPHSTASSSESCTTSTRARTRPRSDHS
jgi:hypothetical protein